MMICMIIEPNERYFLTSKHVYINIIMNNNNIIIIFLATQPCDSVATYLHASTANLYSLFKRLLHVLSWHCLLKLIK